MFDTLSKYVWNKRISNSSYSFIIFLIYKLNGFGALIIIVNNSYLGVFFAFPLCFVVIVGTLLRYRKVYRVFPEK